MLSLEHRQSQSSKLAGPERPDQCFDYQQLAAQSQSRHGERRGHLALSVNGVPGITIDPTNPPAILLGLATPDDLGSFQVTTNAAFNNVLNGFVSNISNQLSAFSDGNVLQAITGIVSMLAASALQCQAADHQQECQRPGRDRQSDLNSVVSTLTSQDNPATLISAKR